MDNPIKSPVQKFLSFLGLKSSNFKPTGNSDKSEITALKTDPKLEKSQPSFAGVRYAALPRVEMEMNSLREAIEFAEDPDFLDRYMLYALYREIWADSHLTGTLRVHATKVIREPFLIVDEAGKEDKEMTKLFKKKWFLEFRKLCIETDFWGHSLVEVAPYKGKENILIELFPRHHVSPERGLILFNPHNVRDGLPFREGGLKDYFIELGNKDSLGLLKIIAREGIRKLYADNDWGTHSERYGMPVTYMRTKETRQAELDKKAEALSSLGANGWLLTDGSDEVDYLESTRGHDMYEARLERADKAINLLILGSTSLGQDGAWVGSMEIAERIAGDFKMVQLQSIEYEVNDTLIPFLIKKGFPLNGKRLVFPSLEKDEDTEKKEDNVEDDAQKNRAPSSVEFSHDLTNEAHLEAEKIELADDIPASDWFEYLSDIAAEIHADTLGGDIFENAIVLELINGISSELFSAYKNGYGVDTADWTVKDKNLIAKVRANLHTFSGAKTAAQITELKESVYKNGKLIPLNDLLKIAKKIDANYNVTYLEAERNAVQTHGTMGSKWVRIEEAQKDFPYLRYETEGDKRVRPEHQRLQGIILPVNDAFWDKFYPPNGWRCRCDVTQLSDEEAPVISESSEAIKLAEKELKDVYFHNNSGKNGRVFSEEHNYYKKLSKEEKEKLNELTPE